MPAGFTEKFGFVVFVLKGISGHGVGLKASGLRFTQPLGKFPGSQP